MTMASVEELTTRIQKQKALVLQPACESRNQTDPVEREKKLFELDDARDDLADLRLEKCLTRCVDECTSAATAVTQQLRTEVFAKLEELEARVSHVELNLNTQRGHQATPENDLGQTVRQLVKGFHEIRTTLDAVDNRTRLSNVVIHGIQEGNPVAEAIKLLKAEERSAKVVQTARFIGKKNANGTRPLLVKFATLQAKDNFMTRSRDREFRGKHPRVSAVQDESYLRRVGASRLAAAAPTLRESFHQIEIRSRFVKFKNEIIDAARFASHYVTIDSQVFDISRAIELNKDYQIDPNFCVQSLPQFLT